MNYNKNLKLTLELWSNRVFNSSVEHFPIQLKFLLNNLNSNKILQGILFKAITNHPKTEQELERINENIHYDFYEQSFENLENQAAFCFQLTEFLVKTEGYQLNMHDGFLVGDFSQTQERVFKDLIQPFIFYLIDVLEESSSTIYLLEKYKRRTEWFTSKNLDNTYRGLKNNYEDFLEDDLRMFLFDQGIDYPFSTPKTVSGRSDIIGNIDTSNPLIVEIKIFDREKGYGKNRIRDGFTQILRYTEDYNKHQGFLVIFNADKAELDFTFEQENSYFPPMLTYNNKTYFFIVINIYQGESASKVGKSEVIQINKKDLVG